MQFLLNNGLYNFWDLFRVLSHKILLTLHIILIIKDHDHDYKMKWNFPFKINLKTQHN